MPPSVEVFNTAVQQHTFHHDDPLLDLSNNSAEHSADQPADNQNIKTPGEHDVLLGRGGGTNNHSGNVKFRGLVNEHKMRYLACSKVEKPKVAREVVQLWRKMKPPGRFLSRKDETKRGAGSIKSSEVVWYEVGDKKAREKASQCLRERTPDVLPYIKHLREQQDAITEQGVSLVHKHLQMQQEQHHTGQVKQSSPQPYTDYNSPGTNRNTLNVQAFATQTRSMPTMPAEPGLMSSHVSPPQAAFATSNGFSLDTRAKMPTASIGHPGVHTAPSNGYTMGGQQQHSMSSIGHAMLSNPVTASELYGEEEYFNSSNQEQQKLHAVRGDASEVEYQHNMMLMQHQVHAHQAQMRHMQQQRMQRMQQDQQQQHQQMQQQQIQQQQQQQQQQQHQQQQQQRIHQQHVQLQQQQQHAAVSAASLFQTSQEPEPYAVQSDPIFADSVPQPPQRHLSPRQPIRNAPVKPALKQASKRGRDVPEERNAPERTQTAASLMSINTTPDSCEITGGEITIEEYRKQLEEYIENNQIQSSDGGSNEDDDDDDDDDECPSDLEDDWEKEREKNMQRQQQDKTRGVSRNPSGLSMMSSKTTSTAKSDLSMVSGLSAGMFSEAPSEGDTLNTREEKMQSNRSLCSSLSLMSELTDLSQNLDHLGLDD